MATRREHDFIGELEISDNFYYGIQTFRATENFHMSGRTLKEYPYFVKAFAQIKKAAALANKEVGVLDPKIADALAKAADRVIAGEFLDQFVVDMVQGGAGTSTNMNSNEVITNIALESLGHKKGEYQYIHPNDHTNLGQSTNDTYPSSIKVATYAKLTDLLAAMNLLKDELEKKAKEFKDIIKMGRTELEDAVPTTLGNTFNAFASYIKSDIEKITAARESMTHLNMGATAIGTGINCHPEYKNVVVKKLKEITGVDFKKADDFIAATQDTADFVHVSGALKTAAVRLSKIANDLRLMNSGPRCGLGEINLPQMQPGSSIMPGKVNPTQTESATMVAVRVMGNDTVVGMAASQGNFELNVFMPVLIDAFIESANLLADSLISLEEKCVKGITVNSEKMDENAHRSLMVAAALNLHIGYENAAKVAKKAHADNSTLCEAGTSLGLFTAEEYDTWIDLMAMTGAEK